MFVRMVVAGRRYAEPGVCPPEVRQCGTFAMYVPQAADFRKLVLKALMSGLLARKGHVTTADSHVNAMSIRSLTT